MDSSEKECLKVLMFPWLAHGHISPLLELAKKLSHSNFQTYICSTPANLSPIKKRITENYSHSIHLVELHLPADELPPHYHTTNGLPVHLHLTLRKALKMAKPNFSNLLNSLQPDLLIHDVLLRWPGSVASLHNIPTLAFCTSGATMWSYFCHLEVHPGVDFPFPAIRLTDYELSRVLDVVKSADKDPEEDQVQTDGIVLMNTSREIEAKYMDYISQMINWEIIPVGALAQDSNTGGRDHDDDIELIEWLGQKDEFSTVFVAFGTEYYMKREEIEEIAYGLELSNVNFIWVLKAQKGEEMKFRESLPPGFLDRVEERGNIVEKWAPQAKILNHSSIAGFVSHCGWNALLESIDFGVPIIAMPMHLDQPLHAKLVVELGVGVEVLRDENGRLHREEISQVIRDVVVGKTGAILRRRVEEVRKIVRLTRREEMEGIVRKLTQLSQKGKTSLNSVANTVIQLSSTTSGLG